MEDDGEDDLHPSHSSEAMEEVARAVTITMLKPSQSPTSAPSPTRHQFAQDIPPLPVHQNGVVHAHSQQVSGGPSLYGCQHPQAAPPRHVSTGSPIVANHQSPVSYENPAMIYDGYQSSQFGYNVPQPYTNRQLASHILARLAAEMERKAAPGWYSNSPHQAAAADQALLEVPSVESMVLSLVDTLYPSIAVTWKTVVERGRSTSIGSRGSPVASY